MSLTQSAERAALNKLIDYLDGNPQENIDKIMDLVNKLVPNRVFPVQREAFTNVIKSRGNWYDLIMRVFSLNPQMRTKLLKTLIVDANLLAWPEQEKNREKYQCNVPWAILLDPTSACNLHCTGCWAAEYGYKQNLSFEDIDSIVTQGKELGTHIYIYTGGAARPQARPDQNLRKTSGLRVSLLYQLHADRRGLLRRYDSRRQFCPRHQRRGQ